MYGSGVAKIVVKDVSVVQSRVRCDIMQYYASTSRQNEYYFLLFSFFLFSRCKMTLRLAAIPDESCDSENDDATSVYSTDSQVGQRHESTSFSFYVQAQKVLKMRRRRNHLPP